MPDTIRVLYIDDDAALGRLMQRFLDRCGMSLDWAASGVEGVQGLRQGGYDAIALDHDLGGESGLEVLARIQAEPSPPPVIYVTGSDDARVAVAALKAGAVDYVWKDVQGHYRDLLVESIRSPLAQDKLRRDKGRADREVREARDRAELLLTRSIIGWPIRWHWSRRWQGSRPRASRRERAPGLARNAGADCRHRRCPPAALHLAGRPLGGHGRLSPKPGAGTRGGDRGLAQRSPAAARGRQGAATSARQGSRGRRRGDRTGDQRLQICLPGRRRRGPCRASPPRRRAAATVRRG